MSLLLLFPTLSTMLITLIAPHVSLAPVPQQQTFFNDYQQKLYFSLIWE